jgi:hypothetical protein
MKNSYLSGSYFCTSFLPPLSFCFVLLRFYSHTQFHTSLHNTAQILVDKSEHKYSITIQYTSHSQMGSNPALYLGGPNFKS